LWQEIATFAYNANLKPTRELIFSNKITLTRFFFLLTLSPNLIFINSACIYIEEGD